eukprot:SAG11_NODE_22316_length_408_cov_0.915858_1_plen_90_part_10
MATSAWRQDENRFLPALGREPVLNWTRTRRGFASSGVVLVVLLSATGELQLAHTHINDEPSLLPHSLNLVETLAEPEPSGCRGRAQSLIV